MLTLREYQKDPVRKAVEFFREENPEPSLLVLPTAAGKSIIAAEVAAACPDPILVVQPTKELLEQNLEKYRLLCGDLAPAGVYSASFKKKEIDHVTFATIGSIKSIGAQFKELGFRKMLIDEAHLYPRKEQSMLGEFLHDSGIRQVLGMTATPLKLEQFNEKQGERFDKWSELIMLTNPSSSGTFFKRILHITQIQEMVNLRYWTPLKYEVLPFNRNALEINTTGTEYTEESVVTTYIANNIRANIVAALDYHKERKHCLVFVPSVEEAEAMASFYPNSVAISGTTPKKRRTEIINDFKSGKIRVVFNCTVLSCLSTDTEILTDDGWKTMDEVKYNSNVAQYDFITEEITFTKPSNIIKKNHTGDMVLSNNKYMSIRVTEDHTIYYLKKSTNNKLSEPQPVEAKELVGKKYIYIPINGFAVPAKIEPKQKKLPTKERFVTTNAYNYRKRGVEHKESIRIAKEQYEIKKNMLYKKPNELTLDECRFIGFWLGDGSKSQTNSKGRKNGIRYSISQSIVYPDMIKWVEDILKKCGIRYSIYKIKKSTRIVNNRQAHFSAANVYNLWLGTGGRNQKVESNLYKLIPYLEKDGTKLYWGLNREQYHALMEGFFKANGTHGNNREYTGKIITSPHKKLLDLLQAVGVCRGYRIIVTKQTLKKGAKTPLYHISLSEIRYHEFVNNTLQTETVKNEKVWCVTMPKGTIITRKNGRVSILGNCGFDYPEIDMIVTGFSTASMAKYYQVLGRGVRIFPGKSDCVIVDAGGNVQRFGRVEDIRFEHDGQRWQMYGSGDTLVTAIPINAIGAITRRDAANARSGAYYIPAISFGKYKGKAFKEIPISYLSWLVTHFQGCDDVIRANVCRVFFDHLRDTRNDPPADTLPDGKHAGEHIGFIETGYLWWYYRSKEWNETNDSLKRGIELFLNIRNH